MVSTPHTHISVALRVPCVCVLVLCVVFADFIIIFCFHFHFTFLLSSRLVHAANVHTHTGPLATNSATRQPPVSSLLVAQINSRTCYFLKRRPRTSTYNFVVFLRLNSNLNLVCSSLSLSRFGFWIGRCAPPYCRNPVCVRFRFPSFIDLAGV